MEAFSNLRVQTGLLNEVAKTLYVLFLNLMTLKLTAISIHMYVIYVYIVIII